MESIYVTFQYRSQIDIGVYHLFELNMKISKPNEPWKACIRKIIETYLDF